jgi:ribbon-helix-helix CopG family protein
VIFRTWLGDVRHSHRGSAADRAGAVGGHWIGSGFLSWTCPSFSLYDMCVVSEEQIQDWADEAEAGYDVDDLKRRGRGRPGRGAEPMQVVAVRLTVEELEALDVAAAKSDMSRSEAIRAALAHFAA